jgi:hypothetical protein
MSCSVNPKDPPAVNDPSGPELTPQATTLVIDDLFAPGEPQPRATATEAEISLGIRQREELIASLQAKKDLAKFNKDLDKALREVDEFADGHDIDLECEESMRKMPNIYLDLLLKQFFGKTLPEEIVYSRDAKLKKWIELKDLNFPRRNAQWRRDENDQLKQLKNEKEGLEFLIAAQKKKRKKDSTIASIVGASPGTWIEYADALLVGRSTRTKHLLKRSLFEEED